jgi:hypothetical protein
MTLSRITQNAFFFSKSIKITNEQQLYDVCLLNAVCGACLNFFLNNFKDGPLEYWDRFFIETKIFFEKICCCWVFVFFEFFSFKYLSNAPKHKFLQPKLVELLNKV